MVPLGFSEDGNLRKEVNDMPVWKCSKCGTTVEGRCLPPKCPKCGAPKEEFKKE